MKVRCSFTIMTVYAPTKETALDVKAALYNRFRDTINYVPKRLSKRLKLAVIDKLLAKVFIEFKLE